MIYAVKFQLLEVVSILVRAENPPDVNATNFLGATALHYAAAVDNKEISALLLKLNADVFIADKHGKTPVHIACKYGSEKVMKLIIDEKPDHIQQITHDTDEEENTPLMLAKSAHSFSPHNIEILIEKGSQLDTFNHHHNCLLHFYSNVDDKEINEEILNKDQTLLHHKNYERETPLHIVAKYGYKETCFLYAKR